MDPQHCFESCRSYNTVHQAAVPGEAAGLHLLALQLQPEPEGQAAAAATTASAAAGGQQLRVQEDEERPPQHSGRDQSISKNKESVQTGVVEEFLFQNKMKEVLLSINLYFKDLKGRGKGKN